MGFCILISIHLGYCLNTRQILTGKKMNDSKTSTTVSRPKMEHPSKRMLLRKFWVIFLVQACVSVSVAGMMLNMLGISQVIWPGDGAYAFENHSFEMGIIISFKLIMLAVMGVVYGRFADKFSRKKLLIFCLILMALARFLNGFVQTEQSTTFIFFVAYYGLLGVGQGGINPLIASYSNDACEMKYRSSFFGLVEVFRQASLVVGMIFSAWLIQAGLWRQYFWITTALLFGAILAVILLLKEPKRGVMHDELKSVLAKDQVKYEYQLNKKTIKSTIFSPTNKLAFIEGIFTWILFSIAIYLIYPYLQGPPYYVSPVASSVLMIIFGIPGAIFGSLAFSRLSDKLANVNVKSRINMIVISMVSLFVIVILLFIIPFPSSTGGTTDIATFLTEPVVYIFGILLFLLRAVLSIYHMNQTPILQVINLPEAQGTINSWNQFLESIGFGLGPLISGYLLTVNNQNYVITALISMCIGIPSILMWLVANKYIHKDIERIKTILKKRAGEMASNENGKHT